MRENYELTVMHTKRNGDVVLHPTTHVEISDGKMRFPVREDELVWLEISEGTVYVMNSRGKTVLTRDL